MKTTKLTVNRTPDRPDGVELEVLEPVGELEEQAMCFMLAGLLRDEIRQGRVKLTLPDDFKVEHRSEGAFLVSSLPKSMTTAPYYVPSQAQALVLLRRRGSQLELVYSDGKPNATATGAKASAAPTQPVESNESSDASVQSPPSVADAADDMAEPQG
jgi:hypothetical protein